MHTPLLPGLTSARSSVHYRGVAEQLRGGRGRSEQLGRTIGTVVFAGIVAAFTIVCSVQICIQVWAPEIVPLPTDCAAGTLLLADSIATARAAAATREGEQGALSAFRQAIGPTWALRPALGLECADDRAAMQRLRAVDRLRYAEEHAVRYGAVDLAERRREVSRLLLPLRP